MGKKDRSGYWKKYKREKLLKLKSGPPEIYEEFKKKARESVKKYQEKNRNIVRQRVKDYRKEISGWFQEYKSHLECKVCKENDPACLCFHHKNPNEKEFGLATVTTKSKSQILKEIAKCDVLCANCHLKLHKNFQGV